MKRRLVIIAVALLAVVGGLVGYSALADRATPAGQPPLVEVNAQTFDDFKNAFNSADGPVRIITLLSPT